MSAAREKTATPCIAIIHGPNLNLLGTREPELYGTMTLAALDEHLRAKGRGFGVDVLSFQSNHEGALIDFIHDMAGRAAGFVINAGGFTHTSVALRDALLGTRVPFVEAHLTNIHAREAFRRRSLLADVAVGVVTGLGTASYELALEGLVRHLEQKR